MAYQHSPQHFQLHQQHGRGPSGSGSFHGRFPGSGEEDAPLLSHPPATPATIALATNGQSLSRGVLLGLQLGIATVYMFVLAGTYGYAAWKKVVIRGADTAELTTILLVVGVLLRYASSLIRQGVTATYARLSTRNATTGDLPIMLLYDLGSWITDEILGALLGRRWTILAIKGWSLLVGFLLGAIIKKGLTVGPASQAWTNNLPADTQNFRLDAGQIPGPLAFFNYSTSIPSGGDFTSGTSPLIACQGINLNTAACARVPVQLSGFHEDALSCSSAPSFSNITLVEVMCVPTTTTMPQAWLIISNDDFDVFTDISYGGTSYYFWTSLRTLQCAIAPFKGSTSLSLKAANGLWSASMIGYGPEDEMVINMPPFRIGSAMAQLLSDGASIAASQVSQTMTAGDLISGGAYDKVLAAIVAVGYTAERADDPPTGQIVMASGEVETTAIILDSLIAAIATAALSCAAALTLLVLLILQSGIRLVFSPLAVISMVENANNSSGLSTATAGCCAGGKPQDRTIRFRLAVNNGTQPSGIGHLSLQLASSPCDNPGELRSGWSQQPNLYGSVGTTATQTHSEI